MSVANAVRRLFFNLFNEVRGIQLVLTPRIISYYYVKCIFFSLKAANKPKKSGISIFAAL